MECTWFHAYHGMCMIHAFEEFLPTFWIRPATWLHSVHETAVPIFQSPQHSWWGLVLAKIPIFLEMWFVDCSCIAWNIQFGTNFPGVSSRFYPLWHKIWVEAWLGQEQSSKLSCAREWRTGVCESSQMLQHLKHIRIITTYISELHNSTVEQTH